ncbi:MFS transporter [Acidobacteriota bacterium]
MDRQKLPRVVLAIHFILLMAFCSVSVLNLFPLFLESLGANARQIGFLVGLFSVSAFLSRPLSGWLLSRLNPKKVLIGGALLMLIMTCLYYIVTDLGWLIICIRIGHGLGFAVFYLAALFITIRAVEERSRTYAIGFVSTGFVLPLLVIPYMAEVIIQKFGFFHFFSVSVFFAIIPVGVSLFVKVPFKRFSLPEHNAGRGFFQYFRQRRIRIVFGLTVLFEIGMSATLSFVPLLVHEGSVMRAGFYYTFLGLTIVFMRLVGGRYFPWWGNPRALLPSFFFLSGGTACLYLSEGNIVLALSGVVCGIGIGILYPHLAAIAVAGISQEEQGMVLSLYASSVDLGFALGPLLFGWISLALGVRVSFIPMAALLMLSSLVLILLNRGILLGHLED